MRSQRRAARTVRLVQVTTTPDTYGDATSSTKTCTIAGALYEPQRPTEQGSDQAPVFQPATFNLPGCWDVDADDKIIDGATTWYVLGGGTVWLNRTKVPVSRTRPV